MKERPILMCAPMVVATLADLKTQTRRPLYVKTKRADRATFDTRYRPSYGNGEYPNVGPGEAWTLSDWRKAQKGLRLWVRETYMPDPPDDGTWAGTAWRGCKDSRLEDIPERFRTPDHCLHRATWQGHDLVGWKPSIHMPRWASRITLELTADVRIERLQDISAADAIAEGVDPAPNLLGEDDMAVYSASRFIERKTGRLGGSMPIARYMVLWESINGPGSWNANPWVCVLSFRRLAC